MEHYFMHARYITPSSNNIITNLQAAVETLQTELQFISTSTVIRDAASFEAFEREIYKRTTMLADVVSAMKLQQALDSADLGKAEKDLIKSQAMKMKDM